MPRAVIFANGQIPELEAARALLQAGDYLIAADGGANYLLKMGLLPDILIGDLDSVDEDILIELTNAEVRIEQYSEDKDETDIELALRYAVELAPSAILIVGALGGRLDQTIANLSLLTDPSLAGTDIRLDDGLEQAFFCRALAAKGGQAEVRGRSGDTVSLIPWQTPVQGVTTAGLRWPLYSETLFPDKSRGVSNVMLSDRVSVDIRSGLLLIVHRRTREILEKETK
jgi:thiamine pyrophosphokinase